MPLFWMILKYIDYLNEFVVFSHKNQQAHFLLIFLQILTGWAVRVKFFFRLALFLGPPMVDATLLLGLTTAGDNVHVSKCCLKLEYGWNRKSSTGAGIFWESVIAKEAAFLLIK